MISECSNRAIHKMWLGWFGSNWKGGEQQTDRLTKYGSVGFASARKNKLSKPAEPRFVNRPVCCSSTFQAPSKPAEPHFVNRSVCFLLLLKRCQSQSSHIFLIHRFCFPTFDNNVSRDIPRLSSGWGARPLQLWPSRWPPLVMTKSTISKSILYENRTTSRLLCSLQFQLCTESAECFPMSLHHCSICYSSMPCFFKRSSDSP